MIKALKVATLAVLAAKAQAIDFGATYQPVCQTPGDAATCATEDLADGNSYEFIYAGNDAVKTVAADGVTYEKVVGHAVPYSATAGNVLTHFDILAVTASTIDCTASRAVLMTATEELGEVAMTNSDGQTCRVNWDGVFQSYADYSTQVGLAVVFEFNALTATDTDSFKMIFMEDTTPIVTVYQQTQPSFVTMEFYATATTVHLELQRNQFIPDTCEFPPSITVTMPGTCALASMTVPLLGGSDSTYEFAITQAQLEGCETSAAQNGDSISYSMDMTAAFPVPTGCDPARAILTDDAIGFSINFGNVAEATGTIQGDIYNVYARVTGYGNVPCDGQLGPMGKPIITVETRGPVGSTADITASNLIMDDVAFEQTTMACDLDGATNEWVCTGEFTALECIPMTNYPDATCNFDQVGDVTGTTTWTWATIPADLVAIANAEDEIGVKAVLMDRIFTTCSVPAQQIDLNGAFGVAVEIEQATTMFEPLVTNIHFTDLDDSASVTLKINKVVVSAGGYTQTFLIGDKLALMNRDRSKYYTDAHFCRYEDVADTCAPFYSTETNPFTAGNPDLFGNAQGYVSCQLNEQRSKDVFTFTPYNYVFSKIEETEITFTITVTAEIDDCATAAQRRLRAIEMGGDRALMTNEELAALDPNAKKIVDNYAVVVVRMPREQGALPEGSGPLLLIIIIIVVVVLLFTSCCAWFFFVRRNKNRKEAEMEAKAQYKLGGEPNEIMMT